MAAYSTTDLLLLLCM